MIPNFEEWAYELADEAETFDGRAKAIEAKLRAAYEAGKAARPEPVRLPADAAGTAHP
jgi:hypothetical protein